MSFVKGSNSALSSSLLLLVLIVKLKALLGCGLQLLALELLQLLHRILVDWINHVQDLKALLPEVLEERRCGHSRHAFARDVIDVVLALL